MDPSSKARVALASALLLAGCASPSASAGPSLAAQWEQEHPELIERAEYRPRSAIGPDPAEVLVFVTQGATAEQIRALACETIDPALAEPANGELGVALWDANGASIPHPDCASD